MLDYQIAVIIFFVCLLLSIVVVGLIEEAIKKHKEKKRFIEELIKENKQLKHKLYTYKFQAELRGLHIED